MGFPRYNSVSRFLEKSGIGPGLQGKQMENTGFRESGCHDEVGGL